MAQAVASRRRKPPRQERYEMRCSGEWRAWLERLADHSRANPADLIEAALVAEAKARGFHEPAPWR